MTDRGSRKALVAVVAVVLCLGVVELIFYVATLFLPGNFNYSEPTRADFDAYLAHADETRNLRPGWLPSAEAISEAGYRLSPAGAGYQAACVSLYGDSFTWGYRVSDAEAWGNVLTEHLGCRVDNFGVSGYGPDQALLRFADNAVDQAPVVVLAVWAENIARIINQDRAMIYSDGIRLKPRFILNGSGDLELVPRPPITAGDLEAYVNDPATFLAHEYFIPERTSLSKRRLGFPYLIRLPYYFTYKRLYLSLLALAFDVPSWYDELYQPEHPSNALQLMTAILVAFDRQARDSGRIPLIFLLPSARDAEYQRSGGPWVYRPLLSALEEHDVQAINIGAEMVRRMGDEDYCDYMCLVKARRSGHYTVKGNRLLADIARDILVAKGLVAAASPRGQATAD